MVATPDCFGFGFAMFEIVIFVCVQAMVPNRLSEAANTLGYKASLAIKSKFLKKKTKKKKQDI